MALLLVGFVGGFLAAISPCVLPVLPVVLLGGATSTGAHRASWLRPLCIVAGLILSFTLFTLSARCCCACWACRPGRCGHWGSPPSR
ncbi:hypothetical protein H7H37_23755, partial [Mycolicibacterium insubricum]|nr:hypothetical protein [Mycolicibacterium insubricum]